MGAQLPIAPGGPFGASLTFQHIGQAVNVYVGIGIANGLLTGHAAPFAYAVKLVAIPADMTLASYTVEVSGTVPASAPTGTLMDAQRFISKTQPIVNQQPPNDFGVNNWDDEVYSTIQNAAFSSLLASYW
jgi:hypothetical protein